MYISILGGQVVTKHQLHDAASLEQAAALRFESRSGTWPRAAHISTSEAWMDLADGHNYGGQTCRLV